LFYFRLFQNFFIPFVGRKIRIYSY
jgi:hypothetical protein